MRVILDECLPKRFGRELVGHDVTTVTQAGFAGVKNGELLRRLVGAIDAFITVDKNLPSQQKISAVSFGIVVLHAPSNRLEDLQPLVPDILTGLATLKPGDVIHFGRT